MPFDGEGKGTLKALRPQIRPLDGKGPSMTIGPLMAMAL